MHVEAALLAVWDEVLKLALEVGLHLQELEPQHLRVHCDRMIAPTGSLRFVDEFVGFHGLLSDGPDGVLEDLAFSASHAGMLPASSVRILLHTCPEQRIYPGMTPLLSPFVGVITLVKLGQKLGQGFSR